MNNDRFELFNLAAKIIDMSEWRRYYLAGELVQRLCEESPEFRARHDQMLDEYLTEPADRALFDLPPKSQQNGQPDTA